MDQFALSGMMKAHSSPARGQKADTFWREVYARLLHLTRSQLATCPYSELHEIESYDAGLQQRLRDVYLRFSGGLSFRPVIEVEKSQACTAARAWVSSQECDWAALTPNAALTGSKDTWWERIFITSRLTFDPQIAEQMEAIRTRTNDAARRVFDTCAAARDRTLQDWREKEVQGGLRAIGDLATVFAAIKNTLADCGVPQSRSEAATRDFQHSPQARSMPYIEIRAYLAAAFSHMIATGGNRKKPNAGSLIDLAIVSHYAPYCDAMFMDKATHELVRQSKVMDKPYFRAHMFSKSEGDGFLQYLHDAEVNAPAGLVAKVQEVYGADWLTAD